jgi:hypothetical protein
MAKTTFANGTVVTAAFLNAINNPVFVDTPDDDGEIAKITNASLSTASGQLLPEWQTFRDTLLVTAGTGLNANYTAGVVTLATGAQQAIAAGSVSLTASTTNWVFVDASGAVAVSTSVPLLGVVLASVVTTATVVSTVTDLRPRFEVKPIQESIKLIGGNGGDGSFATGVVSTANPSGLTSITLDREVYYFSSFTVNSGHTVTLSSGLTRIYCSGPVTITGTLTVSPFLSAMIIAEGGVILGGTSFRSDIDVVRGIGAYRGPVHTWEAQPFGSSGGGANWNFGGAASSLSTSLSGGLGGTGGGGLFIEAAGPVILNGTIEAVGGNGTSVTLGSNSGLLLVAGASGASGGLIHISSLISITRNNGSTLSVRGGNGANAQRGASVTSTANTVYGGRAGGGGYIVLIAPTITTNGTVTTTLSPGTAGTNTTAPDSWNAASGGSFGGRGGNGRTPFEAAENGQLITRLIKPVA